MLRRMRHSSDDGITLVELLIYILLATIVGTIVAGILINSLRVQVQIQDAAASAQGSSLVAQAMGTAVRDSTAMTSSTLPDGTIIVRTRSLDPSVESTTTLGPDSFVCYAFSSSGGDIRFTTSETAIPAVAAGDTQSWTLIADGVQTVGAEPVLAVLDGGRALRVALVTELGNGGPQQLTTTIRSLQTDEPPNEANIVRVSEPCF
jgi:type II secretory pathway pseudopilin PulG